MNGIKKGAAVLVTEYTSGGEPKRESIVVTAINSTDNPDEVAVDYKLGNVNNSIILGKDGTGKDMAGNTKRLEQTGGRRRKTKRRALRRKRTVKRLPKRR